MYVDNHDMLLIRRFESSDMVRQGGRRLRRKSVLSRLTFAHYRFRSFLEWKVERAGKAAVLAVNEACTSKACSWSGQVIDNLGGRKVVTGGDGLRLGRDINGAWGLFLRALGDTPAPMWSEQVQHSLGQCVKWIDHRADAGWRCWR